MSDADVEEMARTARAESRKKSRDSKVGIRRTSTLAAAMGHTHMSSMLSQGLEPLDEDGKSPPMPNRPAVSSSSRSGMMRSPSSHDDGEALGHSLIDTAHHIEDVAAATLGAAKREFGKLPMVDKISWFIHTYIYKPIVLKESNMSADEDVNMFLKGFHQNHQGRGSQNQVRARLGAR
mmetsp:Transcript_43445/g.117864  ORF Transcript_43445/g.117864 Transcript_43445/m.117864 type:complete len:178 (-) Transcript_43445:2162-2695(-)